MRFYQVLFQAGQKTPASQSSPCAQNLWFPLHTSCFMLEILSRSYFFLCFIQSFRQGSLLVLISFDFLLPRLSCHPSPPTEPTFDLTQH